MRFKAILMLAVLTTTLFISSGCSENNQEIATVPVDTVKSDEDSQEKETVQDDEVQEIRIQLKPNKYEPITVKVGIPVRFIIEAEEKNINNCNNAILISEYGIKSDEFVAGDNVIEFTPTETGKFGYSCWMRMIRSSITVVD